MHLRRSSGTGAPASTPWEAWGHDAAAVHSGRSTVGRPAERLPLERPDEPLHRRIFYLGLMLLATAGFFMFTQQFWVPAHQGVDQNGYLVGGKMLAATGTMKIAPSRLVSTGDGDERIAQFDPHQFIGRMWVGADHGTDEERYYPKYPIGLSALYAAALLVSSTYGHSLVFLVSPICMALAVLGTYLLIRQVAGTFFSLLGAVVLATSPVTLALANNPNSHASTVFFVVWGMYLLLRWWQAGGLWRAAGAGLFLGFAVTIRYTEAALLLPMALVALYALRLRMVLLLVIAAYTAAGVVLSGRGWMALMGREDGVPLLWWQSGLFPLLFALFSLVLTIPAWWALVRRVKLSDFAALAGPAVLAMGWAVPVGILLAYNYVAMGTWTGYDPTNESVGFEYAFAADNWETTLRHLNTNGLFFIFPLAVAGMVWMCWWNWRMGTVLIGWVLPCMVIYTFYYWAPDGAATGYLRFYMSILPGLVMAAFWLLDHVRQLAGAALAERRVNISATAVAGVAVSLLVGLIFVWPAYAAQAEEGSEEVAVAAETVAAGGRVLWLLAGAAVAGLVVWALYALWRLVRPAARTGNPAAAAVLTAGVLAAVSVSVHLENGLQAMENDQFSRLVLQDNTYHITEAVPDGSIVFGTDQNLFQYLQFATNNTLYLSESFTRGYVNRLPVNNPEDPQFLDPYRRQAMHERLGGLSNRELLDRQREIIDDAHAKGRRVFMIINRSNAQPNVIQQVLNREASSLDPARRVAPRNRYELEFSDGWIQYNPRTVALEGPRGNRRRAIPPRQRQSPRPAVWQVVEIRPREAQQESGSSRPTMAGGD